MEFIVIFLIILIPGLVIGIIGIINSNKKISNHKKVSSSQLNNPNLGKNKFTNNSQIENKNFQELLDFAKDNMKKVNQELIRLENEKQNSNEIDLGLEAIKERVSRKSILSDYDFTEREILEARNQLKSPYTDRDRIWYILNNRQMNFFAEKEWEDFCDTQEDMAFFLCEDKKYNQALEHYLNAFIVNFSGFFNKDEVWNNFDTISLHNNPLLTDHIKSTMKFGNLTNEKLKLAIDNNKYYNLLPFNYYSKENLYNILLDLFEDNVNKIKEYPYNIPDKNSKLYTYTGY